MFLGSIALSTVKTLDFLVNAALVNFMLKDLHQYLQVIDSSTVFFKLVLLALHDNVTTKANR